MVWNAPSWRYLPTHFGVSLARAVYKRGALAWTAEAS